METHAAQDVKMVLMHAGQYPLADGGECAFVVGQKDCLRKGDYINSKLTTVGGWNACERRTWCNTDYVNSMPAPFSTIFRPMSIVTANGAGDTTQISNDTFAFFAEKEVAGDNALGSATAEASLFQIEWYKTAANRIKDMDPISEDPPQDWMKKMWWTRTCLKTGNTAFVVFNGDGDRPPGDSVTNKDGLAPFGCIGKKVTA